MTDKIVKATYEAIKGMSVSERKNSYNLLQFYFGERAYRRYTRIIGKINKEAEATMTIFGIPVIFDETMPSGEIILRSPKEEVRVKF